MSFRYHLISLAAVLLALAAGVVLGAGPLSTRIDRALATPTSGAAGSTSIATVNALHARLAYDNAFAGSVARQLTTNRLKGQRVVLLVAPGTPAVLVKPTQEALTTAGATVSGEVDLTKAWTDPSRAAVLSGISDQLAPPDVASSTGTPAQRAAAALAASVLTRSASAVGKASDPATALLAGLAQGGFLTTKGSPDERASLAVLLVPTTTHDSVALVPLATALAGAGSGTVVTGATGSAQQGGGVGAIRSDPTSGPSVSTVDTLDLAAGRIALVLALAQQRGGGRGDYGSGPGADSPIPRA